MNFNGEWKETEIGKIPEDWDIDTLNNVCLKITDGAHASPKSFLNGCLMASVKDMSDYGFVFEECKRISKEDYELLVKNDCKPLLNDVLIAKDGSFLKHIFVVKKEIDMVILSSIAILRPKLNGVSPEFLKYYLSSNETKQRIKEGYVTGSVLPRIVLKDFKTIKIILPSLSEQKAIANILSSLDDKIELNNQMNKTLEEIGQTLFKEWFIDFEFPDEEGNPYKSSGGEMVESELGLIPEGWKIKELGEIVSTIIDYRGKTPKKLGDNWSDKGIIALSAKSIKDGNLVNLGKANYVSESLYLKWMKEELEAGDILMTSEGPLGELLYLPSKKRYCLSQRLFAIRANCKIIYPCILYYFFKTREIQQQIHSRATGTTVVGIRQSALRKVPIIIPPIILQRKIALTLNNVLIKKELLYDQTQTLSTIRDTLLPILMSGKIRVNLENGDV